MGLQLKIIDLLATKKKIFWLNFPEERIDIVGSKW